MNGRMEGPKLRKLLFGKDHVPKPLPGPGPGQLPVAEVTGTQSLDKNAAASALAQDDSIWTKKRRLMNGWAGQIHDSREVANNVAWPSAQPLVHQAQQFAPGLPRLPFSSTLQSPGFSPMPSTGAPMHGWAGQRYASGAATSISSAGPSAYRVLQQPASAPLQTMLLPPWPTGFKDNSSRAFC